MRKDESEFTPSLVTNQKNCERKELADDMKLELNCLKLGVTPTPSHFQSGVVVLERDRGPISPKSAGSDGCKPKSGRKTLKRRRK